MDDPEVWRWIWLVTTVVFAAGEMHIAGSFFLAPFAVGAAVATVLGFAGIGLTGELAAFLVVSVAVFAALRPIARRLDQRGITDGIGSRRLIGQPGTVLEPIPVGHHELGLIRVHREEWRAETIDGSAVEAGSPVKVVEQRGTRLIVTPGGVPALPHEEL